MTISVANRLYRPAELSEVGSLVVTLIDGGRQWLDWAMGDPRAHYHFPDENALMDAIQTGLHGSSLVLLPVTGLLVGPRKLMTLAQDDLRLLIRVESGAEVALDRIQAVGRAYGLLSQRRFADTRSMLADLGLTDAPLFQTVDLDDWHALARLSDGLENGATALFHEAVAFAVGKARTPSEFCDYHQSYLDCTRVLGLSDDAPPARGAAADKAVETLLPLSFALLDCPAVDGSVSPWEVRAAISEWVLMGRRIGFARASRAVQQIVAHGGYQGQTGAELRELVHSYVARAQLPFNRDEIGIGQLGQDGVSQRFTLTADGERVVIELTRTGSITLFSFGPATLDEAGQSVASGRI